MSNDGMFEQFEAEEVHEKVSIEELDVATKVYLYARADYDDKKRISNEADALCKDKKRKLIEMMKRAGKKNWEVDGLGKAIITNTFQYTTPKDPDAKKDMLSYFKEQGADVYFSVVSVNHMTLNSWCNEQIESDPKFKMPGVGDPTHQENIQFRRSK